MLEKGVSLHDIEAIDLNFFKLDVALRLSKVDLRKVSIFDISRSNIISPYKEILVEYDFRKEITLKEVRALKRLRPIGFILYLSKSDEVYELMALKAGALDVLHGGMSTSVISERIVTAMRRRAEDMSKKCFSLTINNEKQYLIISDQKLKVTPSELKIIQALASDPGGIVSRVALLSVLEEFGDGANIRSIDSHIKRLRIKFANICSNCKVIESVYRGGYRLSASMAVVWEPLSVQSRSLLKRAESERI